MTEIVCVLVTASRPEEGRVVARALLEARLAACVNIVPGVESHYWWQGNLDQGAECQLIIKTRAALLPRVIACVKQHHSYTVPEIIALPVLGGSPDYLDWVRAETVHPEA